MQTKPERLTRRQADVARAIETLFVRHGHAPSVRDIGRELGLSAGTVHEHLVALEGKGYVRRSGRAFGIELVRPLASPAVAAYAALRGIAVLGTIAAGEPVEAVEDGDRLVPMPGLDAPESDLFYLRVRGDSMRGDAILDGDLVIVRRQDSVADGEIAVCLLEDGTATLKRVYREKGRIRLQPSNEGHEPIFVKRVRVQGKVVGVHRVL
jgi:repressor LexA